MEAIGLFLHELDFAILSKIPAWMGCGHSSRSHNDVDSAFYRIGSVPALRQSAPILLTLGHSSGRHPPGSACSSADPGPRLPCDWQSTVR